jgi:hypothetical protein
MQLLRSARAAIALLLAGAAVVADGALKALRRPDYQDSMACSKSVSSLADEVQRLLAENQRLDVSCSRSLQYYKDMLGYKDKAIVHLEKMNSRHDSDAELVEEFTDSYMNMMCMKTYDAFVGDKEQDARLEVLHLCIGRKSLAPSSLIHHTAKVENNITAKASDCPQARSMQDKVEMLRSTKALKVAKCKAEKAKFRGDLNKKGAEEDKLEGQLYGHHDDKHAIRSRVATEVTTKFCNVITPNYKMNEANIREFWSKNCPS